MSRVELIKTVNDFEYLPKRERKRMMKYMESFYKILGKPKLVKRTFVHPMADSMKEDY